MISQLFFVLYWLLTQSNPIYQLSTVNREFSRQFIVTGNSKLTFDSQHDYLNLLFHLRTKFIWIALKFSRKHKIFSLIFQPLKARFFSMQFTSFWNWFSFAYTISFLTKQLKLIIPKWNGMDATLLNAESKWWCRVDFRLITNKKPIIHIWNIERWWFLITRSTAEKWWISYDSLPLVNSPMLLRTAAVMHSIMYECASNAIAFYRYKLVITTWKCMTA